MGTRSQDRAAQRYQTSSTLSPPQDTLATGITLTKAVLGAQMEHFNVVLGKRRDQNQNLEADVTKDQQVFATVLLVTVAIFLCAMSMLNVSSKIRLKDEVCSNVSAKEDSLGMEFNVLMKTTALLVSILTLWSQ